MKLKFMEHSAALAVVALAAFSAAGCDNIALIGRSSVADQVPEVNEITAEVDRINSRLREIHLRTDSGRPQVIQYTADTRVVYRGREHAVGDLQPGDRVVLQVKQDSRGNDYADLIRVQENVRERDSARARPDIRSDRPDGIDMLAGTVERVDERAASFDVRDSSGERIIVLLPYNPRRSDVEQLQRLRNGDYVRLEGRFLSRDRFELNSFL
jgi:hypothetical protein